MTAIIGYADGVTTWIGGDSRALSGFSHFTPADAKVWKMTTGFDDAMHHYPVVMAGSGVWRTVQAIKHHLTLPALPPKADLTMYLVTAVIPALQKVVKANALDMAVLDDGARTTLMIGLQGRLFVIGYDYSVNEPVSRIAALGYAGDQALAAFVGIDQTMKSLGAESGDVGFMMRLALQIAERLDVTVGPPYEVISTIVE